MLIYDQKGSRGGQSVNCSLSRKNKLDNYSRMNSHMWVKTIRKPFFKLLYFFICDQKVQENRVQAWHFLVKSEYCMLCFCCYFFDYQKICADFSKEIFDTVNWLG